MRYTYRYASKPNNRPRIYYEVCGSNHKDYGVFNYEWQAEDKIKELIAEGVKDKFSIAEREIG